MLLNGVNFMSKNSNEITKENLTAEQIKCDLKGKTKTLIIVATLFLVVAAVILCFVVFKKFSNIIRCALWFASLTTFSVAFATAIAALCSYNYHKNITVVTDKLLKKEIEKKKVLRIPKEPKFKFVFESFGEYTITEQLYGDNNYNWSKKYSVSNTELYETSIEGDEFYLVVSSGKNAKILLIYNKKNFEMQEN